MDFSRRAAKTLRISSAEQLKDHSHEQLSLDVTD